MTDVNGRKIMCREALAKYDQTFQELLVWVKGQFDEKSGGFFHARSSFDIPGLYPDIESSSFAVRIFNLFGVLERMPEAQKARIIAYFKERQEPETGLFIDRNPAMRSDEVMLRRAQVFCAVSFRLLGAEPPYTAHKLELAAPDYMRSVERMLEWMESVELTNAWRGCDKLGSISMWLEWIDPAERESFVTAAFDFLDRLQDAQTGFWGGGRPYIRLSGTFKLLEF